MEVIQGRHKTIKSAPEDVISNMPDIVITNILDRLPLQYAVRTGVLSSNWRYKWTMLSQLVFDDVFFVYLIKTQSKFNQVRILSRILFHLRGAITKFVLSMNPPVLDTEDINHLILFLSRKGIKDLTLNYRGTPIPLKLSTHLFSCLELKHLKLNHCCLHPPPSFHGFPNLLSLELCHVRFKSSNLGEFITHCPSLETLNLGYLSSTGNLKLVDIAKLENLKILSLTLRDLDPSTIISSRCIFELVGSLPKLKELDLDFFECKLTEGCAKQRFPTFFSCIKVLKLSTINLDRDVELSCAFQLIRSLPNVKSLNITTTKHWDPESTLPSYFQVDYNAMDQLQLQNVVFTTCCDASENDLDIIEYLLKCSPFLKEFDIDFNELLESDEKYAFARKVLNLQRRYPAVGINLSS